MCCHTVIHNNVCSCTQSRYLICNDHVEHTRLQKDNEPCFYLETRHVEVLDSPPACIDRFSHADSCLNRHEDIWHFYKWGWRRIDTHFVEEYNAAWIEDKMQGRHRGCAKGEWLFGGEHYCGIGKDFGGRWRHLDYNWEPLVKGESRARKGENLQVKEREIKMEEDMANMDIDSEAKVKTETVNEPDTEDRSLIKIKAEFEGKNVEVDMD